MVLIELNIHSNGLSHITDDGDVKHNLIETWGGGSVVDALFSAERLVNPAYVWSHFNLQQNEAY